MKKFHDKFSQGSIIQIKFRKSEVDTQTFIFHFFLHYLIAPNKKWKAGQIFVAFSEYLNFRFFFVNFDIFESTFEHPGILHLKKF